MKQYKYLSPEGRQANFWNVYTKYIYDNKQHPTQHNVKNPCHKQADNWGFQTPFVSQHQ